MKPGSHDFAIYSGATFSEMVKWLDPDGSTVDLNLYEGLMEIRGPGDPGTLILSLSNGNGRIQPQIDKRARLFIDDNDTRVIGAGNYRYDLLFKRTSDGLVVPLLAGRVKVLLLVTRNEP